MHSACSQDDKVNAIELAAIDSQFFQFSSYVEVLRESEKGFVAAVQTLKKIFASKSKFEHESAANVKYA